MAFGILLVFSVLIKTVSLFSIDS